MTTDDVRPETLGPTLPPWALRVMLASACLCTVAVVGAWSQVSLFAIGVLVALAVAAVLVPGSHAPTTMLSGCALAVLIGADGIVVWTAPAVLGFHAVHVLAALAAVVPWGVPVERAALRPSFERFVIVQAAAQSLVLLAWLVTPG